MKKMLCVILGALLAIVGFPPQHQKHKKTSV